MKPLDPLNPHAKSNEALDVLAVIRQQCFRVTSPTLRPPPARGGGAFCRSAIISTIFTILLFTGVATIAAEVEQSPKLSLSLSLGKNEAFPGEVVPVIVTLRVYDATVRNIGYPRLVAPTGGTVSFAPPTQETDTNDTNTSLHKFSGHISSAKSGTLIVGPATLDCEAMETAKGSAAFFGGQKPHLEKVTSSTSTLVLLPLPSAGKPAHFSGAIGAFSLSVKSLPAQVVIGEPVTVVTTIKGTGSLDDASCPTIVDPSIQSFPVRAMRSASQLVCEQVVVPNKVMAIPSVTWSYFDPVARQYLVLKGDVSSKVIAQPPTQVSQTASTSSSVVVSSQNQSPAAFSRLMLAGTASVFVVLIVALVIFLRRNKQELETTVPDISVDMQGRLQAAEDAVSKGDVELFYNIAFEIVQSVEKSYKLSPGGSVEYKKMSKEKQDVFDELISITAACDKVRYGRTLTDSAVMESNLISLKKLLSNTH